MILLDTNVLSELLRPAPHENVLAWFDEQLRASLFTTTITQAEMLYGAKLLPKGQRRTVLLEAIDAIFTVDMAGKLLHFDAEAADTFSTLAATRQSAGNPISQFDAMIAAIAICHGAALATRNTRDFEHCDIELINPWQ